MKKLLEIAAAGIVATTSAAQAMEDTIKLNKADHYFHSQMKHALVSFPAHIEFFGSHFRTNVGTIINGFGLLNVGEEEELLESGSPLEEADGISLRARLYRKGNQILEDLAEAEEEATAPINLRQRLNEASEEEGITIPPRVGLVIATPEGNRQIFSLEPYLMQELFNNYSAHFRERMIRGMHVDEEEEHPQNVAEIALGQETGFKVEQNGFEARFNTHTLSQNSTSVGKIGVSLEGLHMGDMKLSVSDAGIGFMTVSKDFGTQKDTYFTMNASATAEYPIPLPLPHGHHLRAIANVSPLFLSYMGSSVIENGMAIEQEAAAPTPDFILNSQGGLMYDITHSNWSLNFSALGKTSPYFGKEISFLNQGELGAQLNVRLGDSNYIAWLSQTLEKWDLELGYNTGIGIYDDGGNFNVFAKLKLMHPFNNTLGRYTFNDYTLVEAGGDISWDNMIYGIHGMVAGPNSGLSVIAIMPFSTSDELGKDPQKHEKHQVPLEDKNHK